jgi:hypothetical protein
MLPVWKGEAMSRITSYSTLCPTCKVAGIDRQLGFDDELGSICCDGPEPHTFDRLPDEPAPSVEGSGFAPETQNEPSTTAEEDRAKFSELSAKRKQPTPISSKPPVSIPQQVTPQTPAVEMSVASAEDLAAKFASGELIPMVPLGGAYQMPNGDVLLGVVVPEQWVQAVVSEAEVQGAKNVAAYVGKWLTSDDMRSLIVDALMSYWSNQQTAV